jgi:hypothetical protein
MEATQAKAIVEKNLANIELDNALRSSLECTLPIFEKWIGKVVNGHLGNALKKVLPEGVSCYIASKESMYESIRFTDSSRRSIEIGYSWTGKEFDQKMFEQIKLNLGLWDVPTMDNFDSEYLELVEKQKELNAKIDAFNRKYITNFNQSLGGRYL